MAKSKSHGIRSAQARQSRASAQSTPFNNYGVVVNGDVCTDTINIFVGMPASGPVVRENGPIVLPALPAADSSKDATEEEGTQTVPSVVIHDTNVLGSDSTEETEADGNKREPNGWQLLAVLMQWWRGGYYYLPTTIMGNLPGTNRRQTFEQGTLLEAVIIFVEDHQSWFYNWTHTPVSRRSATEVVRGWGRRGGTALAIILTGLLISGGVVYGSHVIADATDRNTVTLHTDNQRLLNELCSLPNQYGEVELDGRNIAEEGNKIWGRGSLTAQIVLVDGKPVITQTTAHVSGVHTDLGDIVAFYSDGSSITLAAHDALNPNGGDTSFNVTAQPGKKLTSVVIYHGGKHTKLTVPDITAFDLARTCPKPVR